MNTRGHLAAYGGLRGHSVGSSYPWTVVRVGDIWRPFNCVTGKWGAPYRDSYWAHLVAESLAAVPDYN